MTTFSTSDITHLATLSGLTLSGDETEQLQSSLESIIGYVGMLDELDVADVEPTYQVTDLENVYRDDTVIDYGVSREDLLARAPEQASSSVKVPKVL